MHTLMSAEVARNLFVIRADLAKMWRRLTIVFQSFIPLGQNAMNPLRCVTI
jgi:hypothetical protein